MKEGNNVAFWKLGDFKTEIEESQSNLPDSSRSRKRFFFSSFHSVSLSSLGEQHTGICYREAEFPDLQTERVLFDEPICILLQCRFCWPGNERYREAAVLSGQQATLGSLPPSPSRLSIDQNASGCLWIPVFVLSWPNVAQLMPLARQRILAQSVPTPIHSGMVAWKDWRILSHSLSNKHFVTACLPDCQLKCWLPLKINSKK